VNRVLVALAFGGLAAASIACSDGAAPKAYREPLEATPGDPTNRCSAPATCFDACFCDGSSFESCEAVCSTGSGGVSSAGTGGAPAAATGGTPSAGGEQAVEGSGGAPDIPPPPPACMPALPDSSNAEFSCAPNGDLACNNCGDCRQIIDGSAKEAASTCGVQCGGSRSCAASCLETSTTLSAPCSGCLLDFFDCIVGNCLANCLGTTPEACTECARTHPSPTASCSMALEACSGAQSNG
jgi:hypothetical protein